MLRLRAAHSGGRVSKGGFRFNNSVRTAAPGYDIFNVALTSTPTSANSYINAAVAYLGASQGLWQHLLIVVPWNAGDYNNKYSGYAYGAVGCGVDSTIAGCWTFGVDATNVSRSLLFVFVSCGCCVCVCVC